MGHMSEGRVRAALILLGTGHLALGVWQVVAPSSFFIRFAAFGVQNDHYIRDVATLYLALGPALLGAARRPSWRVPILFFAVLQYGFHLVNHLVDIGDAHPRRLGPLDAFSLLVVAALLVLLLREARRAER
jgi:hypothetical protein